MQRTDRKSNILVTFGIIRAVLFRPRGLLIYGTARPPLYDSLMKKNGETFNTSLEAFARVSRRKQQRKGKSS